ncbi:MAG: hypothetical protein AAF740_05320 [Bacteroidota bacterium]
MQITLEIADEDVTKFLNHLKELSFIQNIEIKETSLSSSQREIWKGIKEGLEDVKQGRLLSAESFLGQIKVGEDD